MALERLRSRRAAYTTAGATLALGAPLGLLALRAARGRGGSLGWLALELRSDPWTYLYVTVSTLLAFSLFGFVLGSYADRLVALSTTDPLTGLLNRRALLERLDEELGRASRYAQPLSLLLIDVDQLKLLNDRDGHRAGDEALVSVARALAEGSRAADVAARWGGDEFVVLAPNTGADAAVHLAERVRTLLAGAGRAVVTISAGVATSSPASPLAAAALVQGADAALFEAKRAGRNRVATTAPRASS